MYLMHSRTLRCIIRPTMTSSASLPQTVGDTDDDVSIHPYSNIGPARPMQRKSYDMRILSILQASQCGTKIENSESLNHAFDTYLRSDADVFNFENEDDQASHRMTTYIPETNNDEKSWRYTCSYSNVLGMLIGITLVIIYFWLSNYLSPIDLSLLHQIKAIEERYAELEKLSQEINSLMDERVSSMNSSLDGSKFPKSLLVSAQEVYDLFVNRTGNLGKHVPYAVREVDNLQQTQTKKFLDEESIESFILQSIAQYITRFVPVFVKDHKINYTPDFAEFLRNITNEEISKKYGDAFQLMNFTDEPVSRKYLLEIEENEIREFIHQELEHLKNAPDANSNDLLTAETKPRSLNSLSGKSLTFSSQLNFASRERGARVLGFLTKTGQKDKDFSMTRAIFLGWYDYLTSQGLNSPGSLTYNANHALSRHAPYWQCKSKLCSIGIRLSNVIELREVVITAPRHMQPLSFHPATRISVFIKPRSRSHAKLLRAVQIEDAPGYERSTIDNPYLSKFVKIMQRELQFNAEVNHLPLSVNVTDLHIPIRDLYIELEAEDGSTGVFEIRAHGHATSETTKNDESILENDCSQSAIESISELLQLTTELGEDLPT